MNGGLPGPVSPGEEDEGVGKAGADGRGLVSLSAHLIREGGGSAIAWLVDRSRNQGDDVSTAKLHDGPRMSDAGEDSGRVDGETIQFVWISEDEISGMHFTGCDFIQVKFSSCIDVIFDRCRFEACEFGGDMYSSSFINCSIEGLKFPYIALDDSQFVECRMKGVQFVNASLIGSAVVRSDLRDVQLLDCDATMVTFDDCNLWGAKFDDTAFYGADLSTSKGFDTSDLEPAFGDSQTALPEGIVAPDHWFKEDDNTSAPVDVEGVPGQIAAPLRVIWRDNRLVPDPRGHAEHAFKNPVVISIFRALKADVAILADQPPSNYPIVRHIEALSRLLAKGVAAVNPVEIGYQIEMLKAHILGADEYLSEPTLAQIRGVIAGGSILVMQFPDWRGVVENAAEKDSPYLSAELAASVGQLAVAIRGASATIDRRIALSLETQSTDLTDARGANVVAEGVAGSASNVISALITRMWAMTKGAGAKIGDETLKYTVRTFLDQNKEHLLSIARHAPKTLGWIKDALDQLLK